MHNYKKMVIGSLMLGLASAVSAQPVADNVAAYRGGWTLHGELINFDTDIAAASGIADSGFGMGGGYSGEKGLFNFNFGVSFFFIDDEDQFSQWVENDLTGDTSSEESSIDAGSVYLDGGIQFPLTDSGRFVVGLNAGYRYFDIDRGISYCRDCYSEDVDIESTTYLKPFARLAFTDVASGTLSYYRYNGDKGADNSLQFALNWHF